MTYKQKGQQRSPEVAAPISEIVLAGKFMTPPVAPDEIAKRTGAPPETLPRMKKLERGDIAVVYNVAIFYKENIVPIR